MALPIEQYWQRVNETAATLPAEVYLFSLPNAMKGMLTTGHITVAAKKVAAACIVQGTHRLATEAEAKQFLADRDSRLDKVQERDAMRIAKEKPPVIVMQGGEISRLSQGATAEILAKARKPVTQAES